MEAIKLAKYGREFDAAYRYDGRDLRAVWSLAVDRDLHGTFCDCTVQVNGRKGQ